MIKILSNLLKQDKEKFVVPDCIPIYAIYDDGVFRVGREKYSKTFKFTDINYAVASREDKEAMFLEYSELLNSLDSGATIKPTINNRRLNRLDFEKTIIIPEIGNNITYKLLDRTINVKASCKVHRAVYDRLTEVLEQLKRLNDGREIGDELMDNISRITRLVYELYITTCQNLGSLINRAFQGFSMPMWYRNYFSKKSLQQLVLQKLSPIVNKMIKNATILLGSIDKNRII